MNEFKINKLKYISDYLQKDIVHELERQGHTATKDLKNSVNVKVEEYMKGWRIVGRSLFYGVYVDRGRPKGTKKVPINALIDWIKVKGIEKDKKKIRSAAFAIQMAIFKKGIPTRNKTKKKGFVTKTLDKNKQRVKQDLERIIGQMVQASVLSIINLTNERLRNGN